MKISIPVLDMYIEKCKSTGVKPIFESFTIEAKDEAISHIDSKLFEAYQAYTKGSRIISILEYQAIKSYSEFLENEDDEIEEAAKEIKKAEHGPEKNAKIEELPATDDEFGIEIEIENVGKDIDASFKEIEDEIMKLGEPEKEKAKDGEELVGEESQNSGRQLTEEELLEAAEENNIIMDFLFRRPKINKIMKKATTLRIQGVQAETKAGEMIAKKNEDMEEKIAQLKKKNATPDQIKKFKEKFKENISKFEDTIEKKMDAAIEAADEIEKEADNIATSNYLKKILSKAKIDARMEEAQAKMKTADETKQQELKDSMKDMEQEAAETEQELNAQDGEAKKKVKELGLSDQDFQALDKIKTDLDNLSDKEKVLSNKISTAADDKEKAKIQKSIDGLDAEKFEIWKGLPKILDRVKDKNKKSSMYRGATGVGEINNSAELKDYIDTKTAEAKKREGDDTATTTEPTTTEPTTTEPGKTTTEPTTTEPTTTEPGKGDPAQKKKEIEQKLSTASSKLEKAKKSLEAKKADPNTKPEAIAGIEKNIADLETEVKNLESEKAKLGESNMATFEIAVNYLSSKIDEILNSIENISNYPVNESSKYESVASRFRKALNGK
jgi:archaellum component FlaC